MIQNPATIYARNFLKWAKTTMKIKEGFLPRVQMMFFDKAQDVAIVNPYGLESSPKTGSHGLVFAVNGEEENLAGIVGGKRFGGLKEGEVLVGSPEHNGFVKFGEDGKVTVFGSDICVQAENVTVQAQNVSVESPQTVITGNTLMQGSLSVLGGGGFGTGGSPIARVGDTVNVNSPNGILTGTIVSGSPAGNTST